MNPDPKEEARLKALTASLAAAKATCIRMGIDPMRVDAVEAAGRQAGRVKGSWYVPQHLKVENYYNNLALGEVCRAAWILDSGEKPTGYV